MTQPAHPITRTLTDQEIEQVMVKFGQPNAISYTGAQIVAAGRALIASLESSRLPFPPLNKAMRAVIRNEKCRYDSEDELYTALIQAAGMSPKPLEPVHDDLLPQLGSKVLIHLASCDKWVEHTVAGFYVWGDLAGDPSLQRVFIRVLDQDGIVNARLLKDVRQLNGEPFIKCKDVPNHPTGAQHESPDEAMEHFSQRAGFAHGWENLEYWARQMVCQAMSEIQYAEAMVKQAHSQAKALAEALEESNSLLVACAHEPREWRELEQQISENRSALDAFQSL